VPLRILFMWAICYWMIRRRFMWRCSLQRNSNQDPRSK
jgi:hypothetical protein